ncbi:MAG: hypothetical protein C0620_14420 [Desulfuromonas sp.]|nr:MAG: hypothetical protein C0620_14420 [Desulfuromonas sp.]
MESTPQTQAEHHIEHLLQQLEPGSERYSVLSSAKNFKSSWVDLGQQLKQVRSNRLYSTWGYDSFEDYCSREIRIRRQTADKLTMAYHYLEKNQPSLMEDKLQPLPDYRSIDLLCQADAEGNFTSEQQQELQQAVFEGKLSHPTIAKRFKEMAMDHATTEQRQLTEYKSALSAARRLQGALAFLPDQFAQRNLELAPLIAALEEAIDLLDPDQELIVSDD